MGAKERLKGQQLRALLFPPRPRSRIVELWRIEEGPLLYTSEVEEGVPLIFSPGFGSSLYNYGGLCESFAKHQPVIRVAHPGSDLRAVLPAGLRLLWYRLLGYRDREAAIKVRSYLHRPEARQRRLRQLVAAVEEVCRRTGTSTVDLAGHSFGTDTALQFVLSTSVRVRDLWLFSPHPPGYLIPMAEYSRLPVRSVKIVVGSRDWTRDGVGPRERLLVTEAVGCKASTAVSEGYSHMDFALGAKASGFAVPVSSTTHNLRI